MPEAKKSFKAKVAEVNKKLDAFGSEAISKDTSGAYGATGYAWQYMVDAVNEVFDGWRYDVLDISVKEREKSFYAEAYLQLDISHDGATVTRGPTVGSSVNINEGDAKKGAITDALKKAFSLFSIGNKAMRGELGTPKKNPSKPQPPKTEEPTSSKHMDFVTLINEAVTIEELDEIKASFLKAQQQKELTPGEVKDITARGKSKRAEIAN